MSVQREIAVGMTHNRVVRSRAKREVIGPYHHAVTDRPDLGLAGTGKINAEVYSLSFPINCIAKMVCQVRIPVPLLHVPGAGAWRRIEGKLIDRFLLLGRERIEQLTSA